MTRQEAKEYTARMNNAPGLKACVVRILPFHIDPPHDGDNGWDVEITILGTPQSPRTVGGGFPA